MKNKGLWIGLAAVIFLGSLGACIYMMVRPKGPMVEVIQDGKVIYELDLSRESDREIVVEYQGRQNVIAIQDGDIYMKEADCPDHVCMDTGRLSKAGVPIVCLPNRLMVRYADGSSGEDADGAAG